MSAVDQQFLNLHIWNLKEISKLAEKISENGDSECQSWLYPTAKSSEINIFKSEPKNYTQVLELTIDKLMYVFSLMIKYLENLEGMEGFSPGKNVKRPGNLSLPAMLNILWERIEKFTKTPVFCKNVEMIETSMKTSRLSQTDTCKFMNCNSCEMVQTFITYLVMEVERIMKNDESAVVKEKENLKNFIENSSNYSVMSRWLNAIKKDVGGILKECRKLKTDNEKFMFKLGRFEEVNSTLEEKVKNDALRISTMEKQIEDLIDENNKECERAELKILELKHEICKLRDEKEKMKNSKEC